MSLAVPRPFMSLPAFSSQSELFSTAALDGKLLATDRYRLFAQKVYPVLVKTRSELEACYCADNGRVAVEPVCCWGSACCSIWRHSGPASRRDAALSRWLELRVQPPSGRRDVSPHDAGQLSPAVAWSRI